MGTPLLTLLKDPYILVAAGKLAMPTLSVGVKLQAATLAHRMVSQVPSAWPTWVSPY